MTEYIATEFDLASTEFLSEYEEIVRCRDCSFYHKNYCEKRVSPTASPSEIFWIEVEPDGYCKWGVHREAPDPTCDECGMRCIEKYEAGCPREER